MVSVITSIVITPIAAKKFLASPPHLGQERDQLTELCLVEMAKLLALGLVDPFVDVVEQCEPRARDSRQDEASILAAPFPRDQLGVFEPVEQPRYVGRLSNQALADLVPTETIRLRAAK